MARLRFSHPATRAGFSARLPVPKIGGGYHPVFRGVDPPSFLKAAPPVETFFLAWLIAGFFLPDGGTVDENR